MKIKSMAVYCGSSDTTPEVYRQAAMDLGRLLAGHHIDLVYGGSRQGLMGLTARACLESNGRVFGYISHLIDGKEGGYEGITELHYVETMHERKQKMFERSDAFIIMPGGMGTLDEAFEVMTWRQLGLHNKPIFFIDINRYWSMICHNFFDHMAENNFIRVEDKNLFTLVERVEDLIPFFRAERVSDKTYVSKWA